jgi:preprotein translocase subunit SecB
MADNTQDFSPVQGAGASDDTQPSMQLLAQYVKDLSFENPGIGENVQRPQIDLGVDVQVRRAPDRPQFEVVLKMRVTAAQETKTLFLLELAYAGVFVLNNILEPDMQPILLIECPRLLFPFARRIVADVVRDGNLPPLMLDPIDFSMLYRAKLEETQNGQAPAN